MLPTISLSRKRLIFLPIKFIIGNHKSRGVIPTPARGYTILPVEHGLCALKVITFVPVHFKEGEENGVQ